LLSADDLENLGKIYKRIIATRNGRTPAWTLRKQSHP